MDTLIAIGEQAPPFELLDLQGNRHALQDVLGRIVVLNFWSAECDWCERVDHELTDYVREWQDTVQVWWIASNANEPQGLIEQVAAERNLPMVLMDTHQQVADLYGAQTTPHFFVIDSQGKLAYQGAWDDVTFRQRLPTRVYLPGVIEALLDGQPAEISQTPPYGCVLVRSFAGES